MAPSPTAEATRLADPRRTVQSGTVGHLIAHLPPGIRPAAETVAATVFTSGLNRIMLVAAIIALASGVIALATIRCKHFAGSSQVAAQAANT